MMSLTADQRGEENLPHSHLDVCRLYSYIYQLEYAMACKPRKILYVGKATGVAPYLLSRCPGDPEVITLDIEERFKPDIIGSVLAIPLDDDAVDLTLCCEVLEHLPFESFVPALREMRRVTQRCLVLSLPDVRRFYSVRIKLPLIKLQWQISLRKFAPLSCPAAIFEKIGHYWEIGYKGVGFKTVKQNIQTAGWIINDVRRVYDLSWHTFFELHQPK